MKTVDLFCGCGGMSLGFQNAGADILAAFDNWELSLSVYKKNFRHEAYCFDLSDEKKAVKKIRTFEPEMIIGGPPCQDFSIAGSRKEKKRANLTLSFVRIVGEIAPRLVVMENVYNIEKSKTLPLAVDILKKNNYGITTRVIDASFTGVPQKRKRFFLIGELGASDESFGNALDSNLAEESMTVHDYFGDELDVEYYYAHPRSYNRRAVFSIYEPSSTIRRVNRPIPINYIKHPADKVDVSEDVRPLTTEERSRIQTFPESFQFLGTKSEREHLIANAVPVKMAEYVAKCIFETVN